ncbi:MAG TPA: tetratricopeptide repeat protein [Verrucomicrobiae bacterium]|jgi:tetratricopeptide (TPR) repeat protein
MFDSLAPPVWSWQISLHGGFCVNIMGGMGAAQRDFFVSYAHADNGHQWITRFLQELKDEHRVFTSGRELDYFFDDGSIPHGADWKITLADEIAHSRLFMAFLSPNYFASPECRSEWRLWIGAEISRHILAAGIRPIYIVEVPGLMGGERLTDGQLTAKIAELSKVPGAERPRFLSEVEPVVKYLRRCQLAQAGAFYEVHAFYDAGLEALCREDLRKVLKDLARNLHEHTLLLAQADESNKCSTVPPYNEHFTGRLNELLWLRERLVSDNRTGVIYGVNGLGGIGKTELAFAYSHAFASAYPGGRFLIQCEGRATVRDAILGQDDFTALFRGQISDQARERPETHFAAIVNCLRGRLNSLGHVLLVFDNVSDSALLLRDQTDRLTLLGPKLHILATTRLPRPATGRGEWLKLGELPPDDALELMEKYRPFADETEREAALALVKRLGGFALAVELVAAHLAAHPGVTCAQLAGDIGLEDLEAIAASEEAPVRRHNDQRRLTAVLGPVLRSLKPPQMLAMEYAALLPPDHVPLPWLRALVTADFPEIGKHARLSDPWEDLWRGLEHIALLSRPEDETTEPRLLRVHRLVQELILREHLPPNAPERAERQQALDKFIWERDAVLKNTTNWVESRWELEPMTALAVLWDETSHHRAAGLLNQLGHRWHNLAEWSKAEPLMRRALAIDEKSFGEIHPNVAAILNNLAQLLQATNRLEEAEPLMRRALAIDEKSYGPEHPGVATDLNNLAQLLQATNRLEEAEPLMRRHLEIFLKFTRATGHPHPHLQAAVKNYKGLLQDMGRSEEQIRATLRELAPDFFPG